MLHSKCFNYIKNRSGIQTWEVNWEAIENFEDLKTAFFVFLFHLYFNKRVSRQACFWESVQCWFKWSHIITADSKIKSSTDKCVFRCRQSSVWWVLPAYDYCRTLFVVWTVHNDLITARSAAVESWEEPANIWLTVAKNAFVGWALNCRVRMLLKGAVIFCKVEHELGNYWDPNFLKFYCLQCKKLKTMVMKAL